jgi:hypothetical protein
MTSYSYTHRGFNIVVVKTNGFQGMASNSKGEAFPFTAFHSEPSGAFAEARRIIDAHLNRRR